MFFKKSKSSFYYFICLCTKNLGVLMVDIELRKAYVKSRETGINCYHEVYCSFKSHMTLDLMEKPLTDSNVLSSSFPFLCVCRGQVYFCSSHRWHLQSWWWQDILFLPWGVVGGQRQEHSLPSGSCVQGEILLEESVDSGSFSEEAAQCHAKVYIYPLKFFCLLVVVTHICVLQICNTLLIDVGLSFFSIDHQKMTYF